MTQPHIGTENESGLHATLKRLFARPGDQLEVPVASYIVDIVRGEQLVEIQTSGFSSIRPKLEALLPDHPIQVVHPIATEKWLVKLDPESGERIGRRKSPKHGHLLDVFDEVLRIPHLIGDPHLTLTVALIQEEELRCNDGHGSWRRRGVSIVGHELLELVDTVHLRTPDDYLALLPDELPIPFTNRELAAASPLRLRQAQRATYALVKMGALRRPKRRGRAWLHEPQP